ncbi:NAD(P)-binding protein [Xylariaceae sp. FL1272]|nr:NAD(P)-binding protein [Xylariaceae sp. FL1272]
MWSSLSRDRKIRGSHSKRFVYNTNTMAKTFVLISGGNRGIGLETVKALLESDAGAAPYHIFLGSRNLANGQAVAAELPVAHGNTISAIQLDITSPESVSNAVKQVESQAGRLDVLINNAGVNYDSLEDETEKMRVIYDINVVSTARMITSFKPLLLAQPAEGEMTKRVINVTSSMGSIASRYNPKFEYYSQLHTAYRCTKAALGMLTACTAYDLKDVAKVHAFDPGWVATEFGGQDVATAQQYGAVEPRVSALACRDVVEGKRDNEMDVIVSINGDTFPW